MILSTDSTANLPKEYYEKFNISMIPMQIYMDGNTYDDLSEELSPASYYKKMQAGSVPTTTQINEFRAKEYFEKLLTKHEDILHIGFSSGLSASTSTLMRVADELNKTHENKIVVIDSLNAASGQGILVLKALDLINESKSIDEVKEEITKLIPHVHSFFTIEALKYLVRGGRLSKVSGFIGTLLKIKPILRVDEQGKLVAFKKVISRRKSISELSKICLQNITEKKYVFIDHANCYDDAKELANMLSETLGVTPIITELTQVIGCHTGPGLLAVFFVGN